MNILIMCCIISTLLLFHQAFAANIKERQNADKSIKKNSDDADDLISKTVNGMQDIFAGILDDDDDDDDDVTSYTSKTAENITKSGDEHEVTSKDKPLFEGATKRIGDMLENALKSFEECLESLMTGFYENRGEEQSSRHNGNKGNVSKHENKENAGTQPNNDNNAVVTESKVNEIFTTLKPIPATTASVKQDAKLNTESVHKVETTSAMPATEEHKQETVTDESTHKVETTAEATPTNANNTSEI